MSRTATIMRLTWAVRYSAPPRAPLAAGTFAATAPGPKVELELARGCHLNWADIYRKLASLSIETIWANEPRTCTDGTSGHAAQGMPLPSVTSIAWLPSRLASRDCARRCLCGRTRPMGRPRRAWGRSGDRGPMRYIPATPCIGRSAAQRRPSCDADRLRSRCRHPSSSPD